MTLTGQTLGKYRILSEVGRGSSAIVYLGHDPFVDRPVAVKVAHPERLDDPHLGPAFQRVFFHEAHAAGLLRHPNVTAVYDAGIESGWCYLVMEYVHGHRSLDDFSRHGQLLGLGEAVRVVYQAALALDYAHRQGVVHRDVKPRNLLLDPALQVKVSDFGVAACVGDGQAPLALRAGSPLYMAPEAHGPGAATPQADLYSLGVVLYELLTGTHPFEGVDPCAPGRTPAPLARHRQDLPAILQRIVDRCLAIEPERRYRTGLDLAGDLTLVEEFLRPCAPERGSTEAWQAVRGLVPFAGCDDRALARLLGRALWEPVAAGQPIPMQGLDPGSLCMLVRGAARRGAGRRRGDVLESGDCIPMLAPLDLHGAESGWTALVDCALLRLPADAVDNLPVEARMQLWRSLATRLLERAAGATGLPADDDLR